jgi:hypothetical protein
MNAVLNTVQYAINVHFMVKKALLSKFWLFQELLI